MFHFRNSVADLCGRRRLKAEACGSADIFLFGPHHSAAPPFIDPGFGQLMPSFRPNAQIVPFNLCDIPRTNSDFRGKIDMPRIAAGVFKGISRAGLA